MYKNIPTISNTRGQSTECDKYASNLIEKLDEMELMRNLYASNLSKKLDVMKSMQEDMVNNLSINCKSHDDEDDLGTDSLDHGAGCRDAARICMMILPCTADSDSSSKDTNKPHLKLFSGQAIPHFYQWREMSFIP